MMRSMMMMIVDTYLCSINTHRTTHSTISSSSSSRSRRRRRRRVMGDDRTVAVLV